MWAHHPGTRVLDTRNCFCFATTTRQGERCNSADCSQGNGQAPQKYNSIAFHCYVSLSLDVSLSI